MVGLLTMGFHTAPCHPAARTVGGGQAGNGKTLYKYVGDLVGFFCFVLFCLQGGIFRVLQHFEYKGDALKILRFRRV